MKKLKEQQPFSLWFNPKKYWDRRASKEGLKSVMQRPEMDLAEQRMISTVLNDLQGGDSVLDFGCGIGRFFPLLKKRFKVVWATDFSEEMLRRAKESNGDGVQFCSIDSFINYPFSANSFDAVFCFTVLLHITSDREWKQTLKKLFAISIRYLIICEKFKTKRQILGRHNKLRKLQAYLDEIGRFEWYKFYPNQVNGLDILIIKK